MNKSQLIERVAEKADISKKKARVILLDEASASSGTQLTISAGSNTSVSVLSVSFSN